MAINGTLISNVMVVVRADYSLLVFIVIRSLTRDILAEIMNGNDHEVYIDECLAVRE